MKPKTTTLDLSKAKIGQKLKRRDGRIVTYERWDTSDKLFAHLAGGEWYTKTGEWTSHSHRKDIIAILPLPKRKVKTATHMGQKVDIAENRGKPDLRSNIQRIIANLKSGQDVIGRQIARLEAML